MNDNQNKRRIFSKFQRYFYTHIYIHILQTAAHTHIYVYDIIHARVYKKIIGLKV